MKLWVVLLLLGLVLALWLTGTTLTASQGPGGHSSGGSLDAERQFKLFACQLNELFPEPSPVEKESISLSPSCGSLPMLQVMGRCTVSVGEGQWRRRMTLTFRPEDPSKQSASIELSRDGEQNVDPQDLEPLEPFPADFDSGGATLSLDCKGAGAPCLIEISGPAAPEAGDLSCEAKYRSGS